MISRDRREYMRNYQRNRYNTDSGFKEMNKARTKKRHFLKRLSECLMKRMSAQYSSTSGNLISDI